MASDRLHALTRQLGAPLLPFLPQVFWISRGHVRRGERFAPHLHAHLELIIPERGLYRCRVGGTAVEARPGEAVLICPGDAHEDPLDGPVTYLGCGFQLRPSPDAERSPSILASAAPVTARHVTGSPGLVTLGERVRAALRGSAGGAAQGAKNRNCPPDPFTWATLDAACAMWLWELVARLPLAVRSPLLLAQGVPLANDLTARLRAALAQDPAAALSLADLAQHAGLSPRAFTAACREQLGLTPLAARRQTRCTAATTLLAQGLPVAEAALRLGFANPFHFSRVFRQTMGRSPSAWR